MADDNLFWLDVIAVRLRRWPRWLTAAIVALFVLLPFGIAYLEGALSAVIRDGTWRVILLASTAIIYNLLVVPVFSSTDDQIAAGVRPLSQLSDEQYAALVANAVATRPRMEWLAFGIGVVAQLALFGLPDTVQPLELYIFLAFLFMFGTMGWLIYRALASTRLSRKLSRQPLNVDVFDITPFEPIGRHSLHLVMVFIGGIVISLIFVVRWEGILKWEDIVIYIAVIGVAVLVFFLSMWPAHKLLAKTKQSRVQDATLTISGAYHELMALREQNKSTTEVESKITSWAMLENRLKVTRTWPYNTEMLRRLVLTVLTPIAVGISKIVGVLIASGRP